MIPANWKQDPYIKTGVGPISHTEETDLAEFFAIQACQIDILVDDAVNEGSQNITLKLYGSTDDGANWTQLYWYDASANVFDPASADNTQTHAANQAHLYTTWNCHHKMKLTGQRAAEDATLINIKIRQKHAL
ncbi:MAG: hypothetical protein PVF58_14285 [Candidatus Methanofastidiosia archaeon]|jgi:hypothetical protein